jgi:benzoyl-CoA 2,3-dioxygenase component B
VKIENIPLRNAMNEVSRLSYVKDCEIGVTRWNRLIEKAGFDARLALPSPRFRRSNGSWGKVPTDTTGRPIAQAEYDRRLTDWLPTDADRGFICSLMQAVTEPGKMAAWIAPPDRGINALPVDYEYVRLN